MGKYKDELIKEQEEKRKVFEEGQNKLAKIDKMFEEARSNDSDWDYDNDKQ